MTVGPSLSSLSSLCVQIFFPTATLLINSSPRPTIRCVCSPIELPKASRGLPPPLWQLDVLGFRLPGGWPVSSSKLPDLYTPSPSHNGPGLFPIINPFLHGSQCSASLTELGQIHSFFQMVRGLLGENPQHGGSLEGNMEATP